MLVSGCGQQQSQQQHQQPPAIQQEVKTGPCNVIDVFAGPPNEKSEQYVYVKVDNAPQDVVYLDNKTIYVNGLMFRPDDKNQSILVSNQTVGSNWAGAVVMNGFHLVLNNASGQAVCKAPDCVDLDGGINPLVAGKAHDITGMESEDNCNFINNTSGTLMEAYCKDGRVEQIEQPCPVSAPYCNRAECSAMPPKCTDTDGENPYEKGTVTEPRLAEGPVYEDYCESLNSHWPTPDGCKGPDCGVREYYCFDPWSMDYRDRACPDGCTEGSCTPPQGSSVNLVVTDIDFAEMDSGGFNDETTYGYIVTIKNIGTTEAPGGFQVSVKVPPDRNWPRGQETERTVNEPLRAGESRVIDSINSYFFKNSNGAITTSVTATVDASKSGFDIVGESNLSDNSMTKQFTFQPSSPCVDSDGLDFGKLDDREAAWCQTSGYTFAREGEFVNERYCENNQVKFKRYECPNGCKEGVCVGME
jgi:hypothetical protein